jgi:hypothetical protein
LRFIQLTKFFTKEKKEPAFNWDRCCHLALCLRLILFHYSRSERGFLQWMQPHINLRMMVRSSREVLIISPQTKLKIFWARNWIVSSEQFFKKVELWLVL